MKIKKPTEYEKARDEYGKLDKDSKWRVLDLVDQKTSSHSGPEAEQAFVEALDQVKKKQKDKEEQKIYFYGCLGGG